MGSPQLIAAYQVILIVGECVDKRSECGGWSEENSCLTQLPVWRPSCSAPASEQQVVRMHTVRDLSSALWSLRTSQEAARLLRTSLSLLRCFLFFDICYRIGGITRSAMALSNQVNDQENRMVFAGGLLTLFGSLSAMCNSLASHGLRTWRRAFLLPWLLFFLLVLAFLFLHLAQVFYEHHLRLKWEHLFLFLATYCLFSCWRHIHTQYLVIDFPSTNICNACCAHAYFCFPVDGCCPVIYLMQEKYIVNHCVQIMTLLSFLMLIRKKVDEL